MWIPFFSNLSPIIRIVIKDKSMEPTLREGDTVLVSRIIIQKLKVGDIIVFNHPTPPYIFCKRIMKITETSVWVEGDNKKESVDSRKFGIVERKNIIGKMLMKL